MSINALVHSNPTSPAHTHASASTPRTDALAAQFPPLPPYQPPHPQISRKPTVDDYFVVPPSVLLQGGRKRRRSESGHERPDEGRRIPSQMFTS